MTAQERLNEACRVGDIGGIRAALADGANVNTPWSSFTALEEAASGNHIAAVAYLIDAGARLNEGCPIAPLRMAAAYGHEQMAAMLWERGERYGVKNAIRDAKDHGHLSMAAMLLELVASEKEPAPCA